jgi:hypothetical protein
MSATQPRTQKYERGIYPAKNGHFKARIARDGKPHCQTFPTIEEAREFLATMESVLGPAVFRKPQYSDWETEFARQKAALPKGTDLTGVYFRKTGILVTLTRKGECHYVGHFHDLNLALEARERKKLKLSAAARPARTKTRLA